MPYKDPAKQRAFVARWTADRRKQWLEVHGPCSKCGSSERLEVHHTDPDKKVSHRVWSWTAVRRNAELAKCVVLCKPCHLEETRAQYLAKYPIIHGDRNRGYKRGCKCDECRRAAREYAYRFNPPKYRLNAPRDGQGEAA